jgi:hypothetical protein
LNRLSGGTPENYVTVRYVFIVSRAHPWLYRHLVERFQDDPDVQVVLDRRLADRRRQPSIALPHERRRSERRRVVAAEEDLRVHSHYIVEL